MATSSSDLNAQVSRLEISRRYVKSLRLNHGLVCSQGSPREMGKWLGFTRDSEWGATGEMRTLLIPVQARVVE